jgi:hypothetical protein
LRRNRIVTSSFKILRKCLRNRGRAGGRHSDAQHYYDNLFVVFGDADLTNTVAADKPAILELSDLGIHFAREPYAHIIANNGKVPFRNITVELLQTQGPVKNFYSGINNALEIAPADGAGIPQARVLESNEGRVDAVAVPSSTAWFPPHDGRDRLVVTLDKINDGSGPREKTLPFPPECWLGSQPTQS